MVEIYEHLVQLMKSGQSGTLVTVTEVGGSVPRHVGSKMIVHSDGTIFGTIGGGKIEKEAIEEAQNLFNHEGNLRKSYELTEDNGLLCGGRVELLFEPFGGLDQLIIFGAGHIGQAFCPLAKKAGFQVIVVDNRPEFANMERFPDASQIIAEGYNNSFNRLNFTNRTFIVIVTHGHQHDEEVLQKCIQKPFAYLGMIGSKHKVGIVLKNLKEKGISSELISKVHSPI
jgi:xanthine dehydrogenase accessory factor